MKAIAEGGAISWRGPMRWQVGRAAAMVVGGIFFCFWNLFIDARIIRHRSLETPFTEMVGETPMQFGD
jgi:hypothetical protein